MKIQWNTPTKRYVVRMFCIEFSKKIMLLILFFGIQCVFFNSFCSFLGCDPKKHGIRANKYANFIREMRDRYRICGEHSKIPLIHMAVYVSDLGDSYIEIFEKSLLFHEGKSKMYKNWCCLGF